MKLKVQHVMDSMLVVTNIINRQAAMPQRGKYLLARLHTKLLPEFKTIDARRDDMIKAYSNPQTRLVPDLAFDKMADPMAVVPMISEVVPGEWQVPPEKLAEFTEAWKVIGDTEIDVDVQPMPLICLSLPNGSEGMIEAAELITLGDLVVDTAN